MHELSKEQDLEEITKNNIQIRNKNTIAMDW